MSIQFTFAIGMREGGKGEGLEEEDPSACEWREKKKRKWI